VDVFYTVEEAAAHALPPRDSLPRDKPSGSIPPQENPSGDKPSEDKPPSRDKLSVAQLPRDRRLSPKYIRSFTRGVSKATRSVIDLTGDPQIYEKLHVCFTTILKAGSSRLTERLLEGPPTEDSVIDFDRQEG